MRRPPRIERWCSMRPETVVLLADPPHKPGSAAPQDSAPRRPIIWLRCNDLAPSVGQRLAYFFLGRCPANVLVECGDNTGIVRVSPAMRLGVEMAMGHQPRFLMCAGREQDC